MERNKRRIGVLGQLNTKHGLRRARKNILKKIVNKKQKPGKRLIYGGSSTTEKKKNQVRKKITYAVNNFIKYKRRSAPKSPRDIKVINPQKNSVLGKKEDQRLGIWGKVKKAKWNKVDVYFILEGRRARQRHHHMLPGEAKKKTSINYYFRRGGFSRATMVLWHYGDYGTDYDAMLLCQFELLDVVDAGENKTQGKLV